MVKVVLCATCACGQPLLTRLTTTSRFAYPIVVFSRLLAALLVLTCSVHAPSLARAAPPENIDASVEALFNDGKYLVAAQLQAEALDQLPESLNSRSQRNTWATGAVNCYKQAFAVDPTQCAAITAGVAIADRYLESLIAVYGAAVTNAAEYVGMQELRGELNDNRVQFHCPVPQISPSPTPSSSQLAGLTNEPEKLSRIPRRARPGMKLRLAGIGMMGGGGALLLIGSIAAGVLTTKGTRLSEKLNGLYAEQTAMNCPVVMLVGEPGGCTALRTDVDTTRADGLAVNKGAAGMFAVAGLGGLVLIGGLVSFIVGRKRSTPWHTKAGVRVFPSLGGLIVQGRF